MTVNASSMNPDHALLYRDRNSLWIRIVDWHNRAPVELNTGRLLDPDEPPAQPEDEPILLPSALDKDEIPPGFATVELLLREGQANDALRAIRACLSQRLVLIRDKATHARGQYLNSRAQSVIDRLSAQLKKAEGQYNHAYQAMLTLGMNGDNHKYRKLMKEDLITGNEFERNRPLGQGYERPVSWVWHNTGAMNEHSLDQNWLEEGEIIHW